MGNTNFNDFNWIQDRPMKKDWRNIIWNSICSPKLKTIKEPNIVLLPGADCCEIPMIKNINSQAKIYGSEYHLQIRKQIQNHENYKDIKLLSKTLNDLSRYMKGNNIIPDILCLDCVDAMSNTKLDYLDRFLEIAKEDSIFIHNFVARSNPRHVNNTMSILNIPYRYVNMARNISLIIEYVAKRYNKYLDPISFMYYKDTTIMFSMIFKISNDKSLLGKISSFPFYSVNNDIKIYTHKQFRYHYQTMQLWNSATKKFQKKQFSSIPKEVFDIIDMPNKLQEVQYV